MELTINVTGADFSEDLKTILSSLDEETKKDLAKEVMLKWLNEPLNSERIVAEEKAFRIVQGQDSSVKTLEDAKKSWRFSDAMKNFKGTKEVMIESMVREAITNYQNLSRQLIEQDPKLQEIWENVKSTIQADYPKYVHDATVYFLASKMDELSKGIQSAMFQSSNTQLHVQNINSRLGLQSNY